MHCNRNDERGRVDLPSRQSPFVCGALDDGEESARIEMKERRGG